MSYQPAFSVKLEFFISRDVVLSFIIQPSSTTDRSVLFSDSGRALPSVFAYLNFVYHYFFKSQLTFWDRRMLSRPWFEFLVDKHKKAIVFSIITTLIIYVFILDFCSLMPQFPSKIHRMYKLVLLDPKSLTATFDKLS